MERIREQLFRQLPFTSRLLGETQFYNVSEIPKDADISGAYKGIKGRWFIGDQYDWLARFCHWRGVVDLQLCIHKDDRAQALLEDMVVEGSDGGMKTFRISKEVRETEEYRLFQYFSFPILDLTKPVMAAKSKEQGLQNIMALTWFCHNPRRGLKPCGMCNPCLYTIEEGLGWRVPLSRRILSPFGRYVARPSKMLAKKVLGRIVE